MLEYRIALSYAAREFPRALITTELRAAAVSDAGNAAPQHGEAG